MSLDLLSHNFHELYAAVQNPNSSDIALIPNYSGTRIYCASSGWGRLWKWFFNVLEFISQKNFKLQRLQQAIQKTAKIFADQLPLLENNLKAYRSYIEMKCLGVEVDETKYHSTRKKITAWNEATGPFLHIFHGKCKEKLIHFLGKSGLEDTAAFNCPETLGDIPLIQQFIDLEGHMQGPLPIALFKKLACGEPLRDKETKSLLTWIEENNDTKSPLKLEHFHPALLTLVRQLEKNPLAEKPDLVRLEIALSEFGLTLFKQRDPNHHAWRTKLKPGDTLQCNGKDFTLGDRIGIKLEEDKTFVFTIQNDPPKVVVIGNNRALLGIKRMINQNYGWGVHCADWLYLDPEGRFAVCERLVESIEGRKWDTEHSSVTAADEDLLLPIENMLRWMLEQELTPDNLDIKYLMFNEKGVLKNCKGCIPVEFNFTVMEEFVYKCCGGSQLIYSHIMDHSKLHMHRYRKFYFEMMEAALKGTEKNAADMAALESITDPRIVDRGKELYSEISEMKDICFQKIASEHIIKDPPAVKREIVKEISEFYYKTKLIGLLWPDMAEKVAEKVLKTTPLPLRDLP